MTNHVHQLATPQHKRSIPLIFQALGRGYVQALNRQYRQTGTLWEGRHKASLVDSSSYLLTCYRYIELNPVRDGIVPSPECFPYSSFRYNAQGRLDALVTPHREYLELGDDAEARQDAYQGLFGDELDKDQLQSIRDCANASLVLGNDRFKDQIEAMLGRSVRPGKRGRPSRTKPQARLANPA